LARCGRAHDALEESLRLIPEGIQLTGRAPSLFELAAACGDYEPLANLCRRRGDALGYAMSRLRAGSGT
jgi:hypothetical protein